MSVFEQLNDHERRLYEGLAAFANDKGYITANQRQIAQKIGMARKTLIPARDRLVALGLLVRYEAHYQGKRDNYKLVDIADAEREHRRTARARDATAQKAAADLALPLPLANIR